MALHDPVAVYNAETNLEAQIVKLRLVEAGVEAFAAEDLSTVGLWMFGTLPEIHKPQVWVDRSDVDRARPILVQHEQETAERKRERRAAGPESGQAIEVECEACHARSTFPARLYGTIQDCPACGEYLDVGEINDRDPWWLESDEPDETTEA